MAEKRLIDADEARRRIIAFATGLHSEVLPVDTVMMLLMQIPPVDAVEVVRCQDCKHWDSETWFCDNHSTFGHHGLDWNMFSEDDFCSYGERQDGDGNG